MMRRGIGVIAAASLLVLGACSDGDDDNASAGTSPGSEQQADAGGDEASAGGGAGVEDFDPNDVLVEQTVDVPGSAGDRVTIGVQSLRVDGPVMVLSLAVTPEFTSVAANGEVSVYDTLGGNSWYPELIDAENLKEYSIVSGGSVKSDEVYTSTVNGQPMLAWAVFAAPEDDIDTIDVRVADWWPSFVDVPIER